MKNAINIFIISQLPDVGLDPLRRIWFKKAKKLSRLRIRTNVMKWKKKIHKLYSTEKRRLSTELRNIKKKCRVHAKKRKHLLRSLHTRILHVSMWLGSKGWIYFQACDVCCVWKALMLTCKTYWLVKLHFHAMQYICMGLTVGTKKITKWQAQVENVETTCHFESKDIDRDVYIQRKVCATLRWSASIITTSDSSWETSFTLRLYLFHIWTPTMPKSIYWETDLGYNQAMNNKTKHIL